MMQKIYTVTMFVSSQIIVGLKPPFSVQSVHSVQSVQRAQPTTRTRFSQCLLHTSRHTKPVLMTLTIRTKHQNILGCTKL